MNVATMLGHKHGQRAHAGGTLRTDRVRAYIYPDRAFREITVTINHTTRYDSKGAVVGQQPFGGSRQSGTNDKAGSALNLLRWISPRTIKETFNPLSTTDIPFWRDDATQDIFCVHMVETNL